MAHAQKPDLVFRRNGRVHLNRRVNQFSRLLAGELCASACRVCTARASLCSAVMRSLLATHSIILFPLHFSSRASACTITFQLDSTCLGGRISIHRENYKATNLTVHLEHFVWVEQVEVTGLQAARQMGHGRPTHSWFF